MITGGFGFIGSYIIDFLVKEGAKEIIVFDNFINTNLDLKNEALKIIKGDIGDFELLDRSMQDVDYVFHLAGVRVTRCEDDIELCYNVLIKGTLNVLLACVKNRVKKVVFTSSALVYGDPITFPINENHPLNAKTNYGLAKIINEKMLIAFRKKYGLNFMILRLFNVYGPGMNLSKEHSEVMIKWLDKIENNESLIIYGDGSQVMDFVYVEDVARVVVSALKSDISDGIYNVGSGISISLKGLAEAILRTKNIHLDIIYKENNGLMSVSRLADINKIFKDLNFKPLVDLDTGLRRLITWKDLQN